MIMAKFGRKNGEGQTGNEEDGDCHVIQMLNFIFSRLGFAKYTDLGTVGQFRREKPMDGTCLEWSLKYVF